MLKILDRYIIRKFLTTFFFMLGIIMLLAMVFDLSERLSEFINNQAPISAIILDYYGNFILYSGGDAGTGEFLLFELPDYIWCFCHAVHTYQKETG